MSETTPATLRKIPTIAELVKLAGNVSQSHEKDSLNELLNQPPHASWVKSHPMAKAKNDQGETIPAKYLPIDKVEFLLTYIFQNWRIEVLREQVMFNSISITVRLHVQNPITLEWTYNDGVGAMNVQTDAGKSAADLGAIKAAAVQMALPSAKSYAIKDAAEHFGAIFGRDLNRRDIIQFSGAHTKETPAPAPATAPAPKPLAPSAEYDVSYVAESPAKAVAQTPYPSGTTAKSNSDTLFSNL
tara:strand:- start:476 stop:1204 length:729 start_codon:yes stop_codon:yes gene_type:complete